MTIAYFDCFSGIAGNMVLGALVDAGLPFSYLKKRISRLPLHDYTINCKSVKRNIKGTHVHVLTARDTRARLYVDIRRLLKKSRLEKEVIKIADDIFHNLAQAEGEVHGVPINRVHFHEGGSVDSIIDIVGSAIGFHYFGFKAVYSSPIPITRGKIKTAHGILPVPAPATMNLIKGVALEKACVKDEIVTPTGAAIITTVASYFGECPIHKISKVGYGFGDKTFAGISNALRIIVGEGYPVLVIEANIDDMNPQVFDYVMERLFRAGAVDVSLQPIQMKKNRPAVLLHCQSPWDKKDKLIDIILRETTTLGVRYYPVERKIFTRELKTVDTRIGKIRVKIAKDEKGRVVKRIPEYEDLKKLSKKTKEPLVSILQRFS